MYSIPLFENGNINDNMCSICLDFMNDERVLYIIPECNHKFHTMCVLQWFRSEHSECPLCRRKPDQSQHNNTKLFPLIINYARRKDAPKNLVSMANKYKKIRDKHNEASVDLSTFRKNHKQFLKEYNALRYKKWKLYNKFRRAKMDISSLPVSIIKIHRK